VTGESKAGGLIPQLFTTISWSPDGKRLVFAGGAGDQTGGLNDRSDLYAINTEGTDAKRITNVGDAADPLWSPDGRTIIFARISHAGRRFSESL
jgi:Periplasmic component of the Tol biopolymer transport system